MMTDIKVGDKVRVRKDAPRLYTRWHECDFLHCDSTVKGIELDAAEIERSVGDNGDLYYLTIPLKYLIKVEDEAKEAKFKRGDKVVCKSPFIKKVLTVLGYDDKMPYMVIVDDGRYIDERNLELCTAETEDKILRQREAELNEFAKEELDRVHHPEKYATYEVTIDNVTINWTAYTADLAKEVALKVSTRHNDPEEVADYAVKVAKAVAERLKRK